MQKIFFTGHRTIENDKETIEKLMDTLKKLISEGAVDFYAGGALGWDMLCEKAVIALRENLAPHIKLHLILPCPPEELGDVCVCYFDENHRRSSTAQTVRMAKKAGKEIINLK